MSARTAGLQLAALLSEPGRARRRWVAEADGSQPDGIVWIAVARVLAEYLWDEGEVPESDQNLPRKLRDLVRRALTGEVMTRKTLRRLMAAFDLTDVDQQRLEVEFDEPEDQEWTRLPADGDGLPVHQRYRTVSISEQHFIGADRRPVRHVTTQVLRGGGESYTSQLYMFDTNTIAVVGRRGIREIGPIRPIAAGVFGVDIVLWRPLDVGETTSISYESHFSYGEPPEPEFRRAAFEGVSSLDIRVEFDQAAVPVEIAHAEWDQLGHHQPSRSVATRLEEDWSVHRFFDSVDNSIVGFRWRWD